jgi:hypothetical protein
MNIFANSEGVKQEEIRDNVGYQPKPTDMYEGKVQTAYVTSNEETGSSSLVVLFELTDEKGQKFNHTESECIFSGKTKGDYYIDKKTGEKRTLIGKRKMDELCLLLLGKDLSTVAATGGVEPKTHKVMDWNLRKEVVKELPTVTALNDEPVIVALLSCRTNKEAGQGVNRKATAEERLFNSADKYLDTDKKTYPEKRDGEEATFFDKWVARNQGKVRDTYKAVGTQIGSPSANKPAAKLDL